MGNKKNKTSYEHRRTKKKKYFAAAVEADDDSQCSEAEGIEEVPVAGATQRSISSKKLFGATPWWAEDDNADYISDCLSSEESDSEEEDGAAIRNGNRLLDLEILQRNLLEHALCASCKIERLVLEEIGTYGLGSNLSLSCTNPKCKLFVQFPGSRKGRHFDVNRRSVLAARRIGRGYSGLQKFCTLMDLPKPVTKSNFTRHQRALAKAAHEVAEKSRNAAAKQLLEVEEEGEIAVTFDGTWQRRGHPSLNGVFTAVSWSTGKVIDVHTSDKYYHQCSMWDAKRKAGTISAASHALFLQQHEGSCSANTTRSSPGMESEAAQIIWCRSTQRRGLKYTTYIGDGDCKGFKEVCAAKPYGETVVKKAECTAYVQKCLGKGLRDLKKSCKGEKLADGLRIGGPGRLTDTTIDRLQNYYGMAVRQNTGDLKKMACAIWAGLFHRRSTDEVPRHQFCPEGEESWCGWQRAEAIKRRGEDAEYKHKDGLPEAVYQKILPVYQPLSQRDLLERCLMGATQYANESFNGVIWRMCPKEVNAGHQVVEMAANPATVTFNDGATGLCEVLKEMGCHVGEHTKAGLALEDAERTHFADAASMPYQKERRKKRRRKKKGWEEAKKDHEGVTYEAGGF